MALIVFDTETTGLRPGYIAQLAAINIEGGKATGFNAWFKVKEIEDGAAKANGLSLSLLDKLSGGKDFYDRIDDIRALFDGVADVYGYNTKFDRKFLETEYMRCSLTPPVVAYCDVMANAKAAMQIKKGFKLVNAIEFFGIEDKIPPVVEKIFGVESHSHDARYDASATFVLARKLNLL